MAIIFAMKFASRWNPRQSAISTWVFVLSGFPLSPLFPFSFQRKKQLDSIFKIEMPKIKVRKSSFVCFSIFFFFYLRPFLSLSPSHSSWISFRRELCSYEGVEFLARRRIIRLATKPVESSKLNRNWIGPLHSLAGSSNVDRKSESV